MSWLEIHGLYCVFTVHHAFLKLTFEMVLPFNQNRGQEYNEVEGVYVQQRRENTVQTQISGRIVLDNFA